MKGFTVTFQGKTYRWAGHRWVDVNDNRVPTPEIARNLNSILKGKMNADEESITDPDEMLQLARSLRDSPGQLQRAARLAGLALRARPHHLGTAAVMCGILRDLGRPEEALQIAARFRQSEYLPLLTSRAAALCDLERWEEAYSQIRQVYAIAYKNGREPGEPAHLVYQRIKSEARRLFG